ncbi:MAG: RnfABCDGE type electron transport complex subunit D [Deltaproteobacteria bacterium]|nr:RnfABCDGE type electron transport complex subunit D [Deltaproteobacteria bacterium]
MDFQYDQSGYLLPWFFSSHDRDSLAGRLFSGTGTGQQPGYPGGMLVYGLLIGVLTVIIRIWGSDTDGVIQAILIMNIGTPLFDRIRPRSWGVNTGA